MRLMWAIQKNVGHIYYWSCLKRNTMALILILCFLFPGLTTWTAEEEQPFEVHDWVILVADSQHSANDVIHFKSSLPPFISTRREKTSTKDSNRPMPHGMITFYGDPKEDAEAVLNIKKEGRFQAHWPPAKARTKRLSWLDIQTSMKVDKDLGVFEPLSENHWMTLGRQGNARYLIQKGKLDRFLFYDIKLNYAVPLDLTGGGSDPFRTAVKKDKHVKNLRLYQPEKDGWQVGMHDQLTGRGAKLDVKAMAHTFEKLEPRNRQNILEEWKKTLSATGLFDHEVQLILDVLESHGLNEEELTMIYQLDLESLEELLPIEIYPYPEKVVRVGLVILKDMDPGRIMKVDGLIAQLGDDSWKTREAAFSELKDMGQQVMSKLKKALKTKDEEVVHRVERLIFIAESPAIPSP